MPTRQPSFAFTGRPYERSEAIDAHMPGAFYNDTSDLDWIYASKADIHYYRDEQGQTLLHYLIINNNFKYFRLFLYQDPEAAEIVDYSYNTLLHTAYFWDRQEFIEYLSSRLPELRARKNMRRQLPIALQGVRQPTPQPIIQPEVIDLTEEPEKLEEGNGQQIPDNSFAIEEDSGFPEQYFDFFHLEIDEIQPLDDIAVALANFL